MRYIPIIFLIFFQSCLTAKKVEHKIDKFQVYFPEVVAKKSHQFYPCVTGKTSIDSSLYKQWISEIDSLNSLYNDYQREEVIVVDTILVDSSKKTDCCSFNEVLKARLKSADKLISSLNYKIKTAPIIHDTTTIIDSAGNSACRLELERVKAESLESGNKYHGLLIKFIWAIILLAVSVLFNILQYKK